MNDDLDEHHEGSAGCSRDILDIVDGKYITINLDWDRGIGLNHISIDINIDIEYTKKGILKSYTFRYGNEAERVFSLTLQNEIWIQYWLYIINAIGIITFGAILVVLIELYIVGERKPEPAVRKEGVLDITTEKSIETVKIE